MHSTSKLSTVQQRIDQRAVVLRKQQQLAIAIQTDRLFAVLMVVQWIACVIIALYFSPRAWEGLDSYIHPHVWAAVFLGGLIAAMPIALAVIEPGAPKTRYVIACAQMLFSGLLIHLTGGRIETHFHIFGSLAFLSFYRDWRVLVPATVVVALDHALRGIFWPQSVFGVVNASSWRWIEHAGWVVFEDIFLVWSCVRGANELGMLAARQAALEATNERVEAEVAHKTSRLESVTQELMATARKAGMAEIATGVLHNVGNVLNSVNVSASVAATALRKSEIASLIKAGHLLRENQHHLSTYLTTDDRGKHLPAFFIELADCLGGEQKALLVEMDVLEKGLDHIKQIVGSQQRHARDGKLRQRIDPAELFDEAIAIALGSAADATSIARDYQPIAPAAMDKHKILQILINLLGNAKTAVQGLETSAPLIAVSLRTIDRAGGPHVQFEVADRGMGIPAENLTRIFSHGFTTHEEGHGFGLHNAANEAREMGGSLAVASAGSGRGATFTLDVPLTQLTAAEELMSYAKGPTCKNH